MDITHHLQIKATPETIFNAVATKKGITGWWSKDCTVGESEGQISQLKFDKQGNIVEMGFRTLTLLPHQKVIWEVTENANPAWLGTKIITEISETEDGCQVIFSHADFEAKWNKQEAFEMTKQGWEHFVSSLVAYCETGKGQPW